MENGRNLRPQVVNSKGIIWVLFAFMWLACGKETYKSGLDRGEIASVCTLVYILC